MKEVDMKNSAPHSRKLLEYLQNGDFQIEFSWINKSTLAVIDPLREKILINLALHLVETDVHEYLHLQYPKMDEKTICQRTEKMLARTSRKDIQLLGERLIELILTQEENLN